MSLVRQVCANIFVLDFGELIFEGTPTEMLASSVVRAAYLGSEGVEHGGRGSREHGRGASGSDRVAEPGRGSRSLPGGKAAACSRSKA